MPTLYIHIGMSKTGTSAFQSFICNNRELVLEKCNLYYPKTGIYAKYIHQHLFPFEKNLWDDLVQELQSVNKNADILLSDEYIADRNLIDLSVSDLEVIQSLFPGYNIKIILYIRRVDDFLKSRFNQDIKMGINDYINSPLRTKLTGDLGQSYASYYTKRYDLHDPNLYISELIKITIDRVGKENVLLRIYDKTTLKNADIVADFFELLEREIPNEAIKSPYTNPSLPNQTLPFLAKNILQLSDNDKRLRYTIVNQLRAAYTFPKGDGVGDEHLGEFQQEIEKVDEYIPGYKSLFDKRPLSFSFPEVDVKDPHVLFMTSLSYQILVEQNNQKKQNDELKKQINKLEQTLKIISQSLLSFPNSTQRFFLFFYTPIVKLMAKPKYYNKFKDNPNNFFADTQNTINKMFLKFLELFGPKAKR